MRGPAAETAAFELGDATLATAAERAPLLQTVAALYKSGLLTGGKTHIKNLGGNAGFQISEELSRIPGAVADMVMSPGADAGRLPGQARRQWRAQAMKPPLRTCGRRARY